MSIRLRLSLVIIAVTALGFYILADWIADDLRPRYLMVMEESMVETANLLAALLEADSQGIANLRATLEGAKRRQFQARIYDYVKDDFSLRVYVTDNKGIVLFDSEGKAEGSNYCLWNDVRRTLFGEYGARTTRDNPNDSNSSVLYVAAPVRSGKEITGVVTLAKPSNSLALFLSSAKGAMVAAIALAAAVVAGLILVFTHWITVPLRLLTSHARAIRDGGREDLPPLGKSEIGQLGRAFEEMRDALEGKRYVENYVQAMTHEMKSPLAAIGGAAELLEEDMRPEDRKRFVRNIRNETERLRAIADKMLDLAQIEGRKSLQDAEQVNMRSLANGIRESLEPILTANNVQLSCEVADGLAVTGERFLLRQALMNILHNAIDFSPAGGRITLKAERLEKRNIISVSDTGPGIPDYARESVFERFYSLPRPSTGRKSTGLGLAFVREAMDLHNGTAAAANNPSGGACITLSWPENPDHIQQAIAKKHPHLPGNF